MKPQFSKFRMLYIIVTALLALSDNAVAQTQLYTYEVKDDSIRDCAHFRFSICLTNNSNSPAELPLRAVQGSLWIDSGFVNGSARLTYVQGSSELTGSSI